MKRYLLAIALLFAASAPLLAGPEGKATADPTFQDGGNKLRMVNVSPSSNSVILISSAPENASLGIGAWRKREIVNTSNSGALMVLPDNTSFTTYLSSYGVNLASDTKGLSRGDSFVVPHQGEVWGIWSPGTIETGPGAGGYESYWKK